MHDKPDGRIHNPDLLSINPTEHGTLELEPKAGVTIEFARRKDGYHVACQKSGNRVGRVVSDFDDACTLLHWALESPQEFRNTNETPLDNAKP